MRASLVLFTSALATVAFASLVSAQGADGLGAPRTSTEATPTEATPTEATPTEDAAQSGETTPAEATEEAPPTTTGASTPPPAGAPVVPPGYESGTPSPYTPTPAPAPGLYPAPYPGPGAYPMPTPRPRLTRVRFREGMEVPPHGRLIERRLNFLLWPGLGIFAVSYTLGTLLVIESDDGLAAIPFVGPLIWQARDGISSDLEYTIPAALFQVVGVLAFALGVKKRRYLEVWRVGDEPVPGPVTRREIAVLPNFHRHGGGISLMVR